jgi:hypothetical protein
MKLAIILFSGILAFGAHSAMADDTVKVLVGTQTYQCEINTVLTCKAVNALQQKEMTVKKSGGKIQIADAAKGLSIDIDTTFENADMSYAVTLCSNTACTLSSSNGGANGYINQTMFGQYNITEKSFFVIGFFITTQNKPISLDAKLLSNLKLRHF